jgi:hypothetical protein
LSAVIPSRSNKGGCLTCRWVAELSAEDQAAFDAWIEDGKSLTQLWEVATADAEHPFPVSITALRHHVRNHR